MKLGDDVLEKLAVNSEAAAKAADELARTSDDEEAARFYRDYAAMIRARLAQWWPRK